LRSHGDDPLEPECTIGIFSHTRPIAKAFLKQIKREAETNPVLRECFPDIIWEDPHKDSPSWSDDGGLIFNRKGNPKEATIEAHGLVDGQPVSKHYSVLVYDDVVVPASVATPEMMKKTLEALEQSYYLGTDGGVKRFIGTRYHFSDAYKTIMDRGTATPRIYPATIDGTMEGEPVLLSKEAISERRRDQGPY